jgi:flavorubredoxin
MTSSQSPSTASEESYYEETGSETGELLPRQLADGLFWLGDCQLVPLPDGSIEHSYSSTFLICGDDRSMLVDTGHPKDWPVVESQLDPLLADAPPLEWIFPTHPEVTHSGNLGRWLHKFPDAKMCGEARDYHLVFPKYADRMVAVEVGDEIDLGNRPIVFVDAVFRDLVSSIWAYDTRGKALFSGDGLGYGHYHAAEQCGRLAEETPDLEIGDLVGIFLEYALYWTRLKDVTPYLDRLDRLMEVEYPVEIICGAHGAPVMSPSTTMPKIRKGIIDLAATYSLRVRDGGED